MSGIRFAVAALLILSLAPEAHAAMSDQGRSVVESSLKKLDAAYNAHDAAAVAAQFSDDVLFVPARPSPTLGAVITGRKGVEQFFAAAFKTFDHETAKVLETRPVSDTGIAFVADLVLTGPGTHAPARVEAHIGSVLVKSSGQWQIKISVVNAAPPPAKAR